jgi:hypothetical protein
MERPSGSEKTLSRINHRLILHNCVEVDQVWFVICVLPSSSPSPEGISPHRICTVGSGKESAVRSEEMAPAATNACPDTFKCPSRGNTKSDGMGVACAWMAMSMTGTPIFQSATI